MIDNHVLKNAPTNYAISMTNVFETNTDEVKVVKTAVPVNAIKRIQFSVISDVSVNLIMLGINAADDKVIACLNNTGEIIYDAMANCDMYKIDRTVYSGLFAITTFGAKIGHGYSVVLGCIV